MELTKLIAHPDNTRIYTPQDLGDLEQSLESHGLLEPIAITKDNIVISGHRRLAAMKNLGWLECEVRFVAELVGIALRKAGDALSVCDRTKCFVRIALGGSQGSDLNGINKSQVQSYQR